jgi:hypothetical protein
VLKEERNCHRFFFCPFSGIILEYSYQLSSEWVQSMSKVIDNVDVIAEFKADGTIIPMRFRAMNEDGEYESFTIKAYKQVPKKGTYTTEDGVYICNEDLLFQCKIIVLNTERIVRLYFFKQKSSWRLGI